MSLFYQPIVDALKLYLFGYARKSSRPDDKQAASIPKQKRFIYGTSEFLQQQPTVCEYFEERESAKKAGIRMEFTKLLAGIRQAAAEGKKCGIKTWEMTRLARNAEEAGKIIDMAFQSKILECVITERRVFTIRDGVSAWYRAFEESQNELITLTNRTRGGMREKAKLGWNPRPVLPSGYQHNLNWQKDGQPRIITIEPDFRILKEVDAAFLTRNYSMLDIKQLAEDKGLANRHTGKPFTASFFPYFFVNKFYHDGFSWEGIYYPNGKHEKLRTLETYSRLQAQLKLTSRKTRPKATYIQKNTDPQPLYRGLIKCICGSMMSQNWVYKTKCPDCKRTVSLKHQSTCLGCGLNLKTVKDLKITDRKYWSCNNKKGTCTNPNRSLSEPKISDQVYQAFSNITIKVGFADLLRRHSDSEHQKDLSFRENHLASLQERKFALNDEQFNLAGLRAKNKITNEHFEQHNQRIELELLEIDEEIGKFERQSGNWRDTHFSCLKLAMTAQQILEEHDNYPSKRELLSLFRGMITANGSQITINFPTVINQNRDYCEIWEKLEKWQKPAEALINQPLSRTSQDLDIVGNRQLPKPTKSVEEYGFLEEKEGQKTPLIDRRAYLRQSQTIITQDLKHHYFFEALINSSLFGPD